MVRAFMMSLLMRQWAMLPGEFIPKYPNAWLVWEPGVWNVPPMDPENSRVTRLPSQQASQRPSQGDALCFALSLGKATTFDLSVGRSHENNVVINDATVSRAHLMLRKDETRWSVQALKASEHQGRPLPVGDPAPLRSGEQLKAGDVMLTFYEAVDFPKRLEEEKKRLGF